MVKQYTGIDLLRGIGIFTLLVMHTGFYFYSGIYEIDFNNPPLVVTLIGFLLMFAGLFAMLSGASHMIGMLRGKWTSREIIRRKVAAGGFILLTAYLYFVFTGPGLIDLVGRGMNNSIGVELLRHGRLIGTNVERVLYIDSLVMIGTNVILLGLVVALMQRLPEKYRQSPNLLLAGGLAFFAVSLLRLPLYDVYMSARERGAWGVTLLLNGLVNKNNPILPYFSFGLLGAWLGVLFESGVRRVNKAYLPGVVLMVLGIAAYVMLPDTMLERKIDPKWFSIMGMQLGLFIIMIVTAVKACDLRAKPYTPGPIVRFFLRFGVAGWTPFVLESLLAAVIYSFLGMFYPTITFGLAGALGFGMTLALLWGITLVLWERVGYKYGVEYFYCLWMRRVGGSSKEEKLQRGESG